MANIWLLRKIWNFQLFEKNLSVGLVINEHKKFLSQFTNAELQKKKTTALSETFLLLYHKQQENEWEA